MQMPSKDWMACVDIMRDAGPQAWILSGNAQNACDCPDFQAPSTPRLNTADSARLHLQHGPIDLIIAAQGVTEEVTAAYLQAKHCFADILNTLAAQLPLLRQTLNSRSHQESFNGDVAQRMYRAAIPYRSSQVSPMIAVAGAVADHVMVAMCVGRQLDRVQVNNGGDIALNQAPGISTRIGICPSPYAAYHQDVVTLNARALVGGIATSGWQGRSHSLGIADAVTVLAQDAAAADAAATLIANAVDLPHSCKIHRVPAQSLSPDSDLGERLVTVAVATLSRTEKSCALAAGASLAQLLLAKGLLKAAYLHVQGQSRVVGTLFEHSPPPELASI